MSQKKIGKIDLVRVDETRIRTVINIYYHWKQLDTEIRTLSTRGVNFPSELSEYMVAYALGIYVNKGSGGDMMDSKGKVYESKALSSDNTDAPSSFSPQTHFDELIFSRLIKQDDVLYIYKTGLTSDDMKPIQVSSTQTFEEQQLQGRRPRFPLYPLMEKLGIKPCLLFNIRERKIEKL